jgi:hypothetical protein
MRATSLDVAPAGFGMRDVRLAWSDRHGLFATLIQEPTIDGAQIGAIGAFLAPGAAAFGPSEAHRRLRGSPGAGPGFARDGAPIAVWRAFTDAAVPGVPNEIRRQEVLMSTRPG